MGGDVGKQWEKTKDYASDPSKVAVDLSTFGTQSLFEESVYQGKEVTGLNEMERQQKKEIERQKAIQKSQEDALKAEEDERKARLSRARQGRRSLLYSGGDESGVQRKTTLG